MAKETSTTRIIDQQFQSLAGGDPGSGMAGNDVELGITFPRDSFAR